MIGCETPGEQGHGSVKSESALGALYSHGRVEGVLFVVFLPLLGYWFAFWDHGLLVPPSTWIVANVILIVIWSLVHVATMWLNANLDRDEEVVLWGGEANHRLPRHITAYASLALAVAISLGLLRSLSVGLCVLGAASLSLSYSHRRTAWKGHSLLGPLTNVLGYGLLAPLSGFLLTELPPTFRGALTLALFATTIAAVYFAAQAYQALEDRARSYRTFAALYGSGATLKLARALLLCAVGGLLVLTAIGFFPRALFTLVLPFAAIDLYFRRWARQVDGGSAKWVRGFIFRLLCAAIWGLVVVCVIYEYQELLGEPRGGLGTARGHPTM